MFIGTDCRQTSWNYSRNFGLNIPVLCPGVPNSILDPKNNWEDKTAYDKTAQKLLAAFTENYQQDHAKDVLEMVTA